MLRIVMCLAMLPFLGAFAKWRKVIISFVMSVRLSVRPSIRWKVLGSHWTVFSVIWYLWILLKSVKKIQVSLKSDKNAGYLTWRPIYIFILPRSSLLRMRNVSDSICRENENVRFVCHNFFFGNRAVYEVIWKNIAGLGRPQMILWRMRIACWIPKTINTHTQVL
jgi:hypothetical protein